MDHQQLSTSSYILKYFSFILMVLIIIISILGNLLVCLAICIERRLRKLCNWFLISLAMADLFVGLIVMSFALTSSLLDKWVFGKLLCRLYISFDVMCCTASILNLCAITTDRFLHIKDPYNYDKYMNRKVVLLSITLIWVLSATISFVPLHFGWHKLSIFQNSQFNDKKVLINSSFSLTNKKKDELDDELNCNLEFSLFYAVTSSCISFYLPCIVMVALYTRLYLYARRHVKDIRKTCKPLNYKKKVDQPKNLIKKSNSNNELSELKIKPNSLETNLSSVRIEKNSQNFCEISENQKPSLINQQIVDHKAEITIGVIMGTFLFCWVPFFIMNIVICIHKDWAQTTVFELISWLGWANSAINPIIYSIFNREFRSAFHRILTTWPLGNCSLYKLKNRFLLTQKSSNNKHVLRSNKGKQGNETKILSLDKRKSLKEKNFVNSNCVDEIDLKNIKNENLEKKTQVVHNISEKLAITNTKSINNLNEQKILMVSIQNSSSYKKSVVV